MFSRSLKPVAAAVAQNGAKNFSTSSQRNFKVVVAGAAGGIGQPLSLLLKQNPLVTRLALYDLAPVTPGVAVDLSHMDTKAKVTGHKGAEELAAAIKDADVVVIPAGVPRKPGMTRDDLFNTNASIVRDLAQCVAANAPKAIMAIITNPVNSMVPIASEVLKKAGVYDPARVLGVTTLDVVRAAAFIGEINGVDPQSVKIPVIGGHSGVTIIPVLSQSQPAVKLSDQEKIKALTLRIQEAGTESIPVLSQSQPAQEKIKALTPRIQATGVEVSESGKREPPPYRILQAGVYELGVTTLDVVRAAAFIGEINGVDPQSVKIPVIGGHSGVTIIPVLSQSQPAVKLSDQEKIKALTLRIQEAGTEVVKAKAGGGSATLSMAYAGARLTGSVLRGLKGDSNVIECAYVKSDVTESPYFANPVVLGKKGVEKNLGFGSLNAYEKELLKEAIPELLKNIKKGVDFVK